MRILYVDDDPDIREIAQLALGREPGWDVRAVGSGRAALDLLDAAAWTPDVVMLDVMMPAMDGVETLARIRLRHAAPVMPVIFITARIMHSERERLMSLGATGVIGKPFDPMRLARDVRQILERT